MCSLERIEVHDEIVRDRVGAGMSAGVQTKASSRCRTNVRPTSDATEREQPRVRYLRVSLAPTPLVDTSLGEVELALLLCCFECPDGERAEDGTGMAFPSGEDIEQRAYRSACWNPNANWLRGEMSPGAPPRL